MPAAVLAGILTLLAGGLAGIGNHMLSQPGADLKVVILLLALATLGVQLRQGGTSGLWSVSVSTVVLAAAIPIAGPIGTFVAGGLSYLSDLQVKKWENRFFNGAMTATMGAAGSLVYILAGGVLVNDMPTSPGGLLLRVGGPLLIAYVVMIAVNVLCIGLVSAVTRRTRVLPVARTVLRSLGWGYLAHVVIGFLFVLLWGPVGLGAGSALFVLGPLLIAHWAIGREALARREHRETVTSFVAALEEADPASVGHSARVADLAEALGGELGVGVRDAEELRYAALLHDIGMVVVRPELPTEAQADDVDYLTALIGHPQAGANILSGLAFLKGSLPGIAHHHERWDGRGYPAGLHGEEIPLAARIIAVADAFEALTSGASAPELDAADAVTLLQERAGSHLDPQVVRALTVVVGRSPEAWRGRPNGAAVTARQARLPDHDHPSVIDAYAEWQPESVETV